MSRKKIGVRYEQRAKRLLLLKLQCVTQTTKYLFSHCGSFSIFSSQKKISLNWFLHKLYFRIIDTKSYCANYGAKFKPNFDHWNAHQPTVDSQHLYAVLSSSFICFRSYCRLNGGDSISIVFLVFLTAVRRTFYVSARFKRFTRCDLILSLVWFSCKNGFWCNLYKSHRNW